MEISIFLLKVKILIFIIIIIIIINNFFYIMRKDSLKLVGDILLGQLAGGTLTGAGAGKEDGDEEDDNEELQRPRGELVKGSCMNL